MSSPRYTSPRTIQPSGSPLSRVPPPPAPLSRPYQEYSPGVLPPSPPRSSTSPRSSIPNVPPPPSPRSSMSSSYRSRSPPRSSMSSSYRSRSPPRSSMSSSYRSTSPRSRSPPPSSPRSSMSSSYRSTSSRKPSGPFTTTLTRTSPRYGVPEKVMGVKAASSLRYDKHLKVRALTLDTSTKVEGTTPTSGEVAIIVNEGTAIVRTPNQTDEVHMGRTLVIPARSRYSISWNNYTTRVILISNANFLD